MKPTVHERHTRGTKGDRLKLHDIDRQQRLVEWHEVESDRRSQACRGNGDTSALRHANARQGELIGRVLDLTIAIEIRDRGCVSQRAATQPRQAIVQPCSSDRLKLQGGSHHQCAELNASTKLLVAIRSANRISSAGVIARITLPMRSPASAASCRFVRYGAPDSDRTS